MVIDIKDIQDFLFCPIYQRFKANKIFTPYTSIVKKFDKDIHKFSIAYNTTLSSNNKINIEESKSIFGSLWFGAKTHNDFIFIETGDKRDDYAKFRKKAIDSIIDFHDFNLKNQYKPISVNYKYKIPIISNLFLTGYIDIIKEIDNKIVITNYVSKTNLIGNINNDIETIAMAYAFRYIFNTKEDNTTIYFYDKAREVNIDINDTTIERFKLNIINIAKSINNKLIYFASYDRCLKCAYKDMCTNSKYIDEIIKGA